MAVKRKRRDAGLKQGGRSYRKRRRVTTAPKKAVPKYNRRTGGYVGMVRKYVDSWNTGTALTAPTDATGAEIDATSAGPIALSQLCGVIVGAGEVGRTGDKVRWTSLQLTGTVTCSPQVDQTALDVGTKVYLAVVLDTQSNGAQLNSEDVYTNPSATASLAASPLRDMERSKRFKVLKVMTHDFAPPAVAYDGTNIEQGGLIWSFDCFINMDIITQYFNTTNQVASVLDNSFHLIGYTNSTLLAPTVQYNCRGRFIDMN